MQIFVSYAEADRDFALQITHHLKSRGAHAWIDLEDAPDDDKVTWEVAVQTAIDESDILLFVVSADALEQTYMLDDWQYFAQQGRAIVVVLIEDLEVPMELQQRNPVLFQNADDANAMNRLQLLLLEHASRISTDKWRRPPNSE